MAVHVRSYKRLSVALVGNYTHALFIYAAYDHMITEIFYSKAYRTDSVQEKLVTDIT